ncbi:MAG: lipoyl(octanoyl) transferase LipB [Bacteroidales bacterium]|nr:lipoyl(octanoyl) transferase LipB [Bacteroidales bacterium]
MYSVEFQDIGLINYIDAWKYQEELFEKLSTNSENTNKVGYLLFCEHPHVYTLGNSGNPNHLLINEEFLKSIQATYVKTNRGGDITYHGPGQIVGYPIFNLRILNIGIKRYVFLIEESIIQTLKYFDIVAERLEGATGVWIETNDKFRARKICAIGVRVSKGITMHGFAFNINTNLQYFQYIVPCGIQDKGVTSLQKELNKHIDIEMVKQVLKKNIIQIFNLTV